MLQWKNILIFDRDPGLALDLAMAVAAAGGTIIGPATTVQHVRILANKTRLDGVIYDLDADDAESQAVLEALVEAGIAAVVSSDGELPAPVATRSTQVAMFRKACPHPVLVEALDGRIGT